MERLQKVLSKAGIASRRAAEELILAGRVKVNGQVVKELGLKVNLTKDRIDFDEIRIREEKKIYIILNKPKGYVTTLSDPEGRQKVTDLLVGVTERVYPVGRLDYHSEGLLLLTNDGELANHLTHPKFGVKKTYLVKVQGKPSYEKIQALRVGVRLMDKNGRLSKREKSGPAQVEIVKKGKSLTNATLMIQIAEGKKREIRRMMDSIGHSVLKLERIKFGPLNVKGLKRGEFRYLTAEEIQRLKVAIMRKNRS